MRARNNDISDEKSSQPGNRLATRYSPKCLWKFVEPSLLQAIITSRFALLSRGSYSSWSCPYQRVGPDERDWFWPTGAMSLAAVLHMTISSSKKAGSEGRISPRHAFETRIGIRLQRGGQSVSLDGWTRNLSEGGVNAFVAHSLNMGELVTIEIQFSESGKEAIPAEIVRTLGTEYGFHFTALSVEQRAQIQSVLKAQPEIPHSRRRK